MKEKLAQKYQIEKIKNDLWVAGVAQLIWLTPCIVSLFVDDVEIVYKILIWVVFGFISTVSWIWFFQGRKREE